MANKKSLNIFLGLNSGSFDKGINNAQKKLKKFGKSMTNAGKSMSTNLTAPLVGIGLLAGKTFMDFEQSMLKVKAISGATGEQFKMLQSDAKRLGSTTMFTASQVASLQLELSKLGLTPEEINKSTQSVLDLAQATDSDLAQAATVSAKIMQAFGLEASDMTRITDVMADSFSSSALDMNKFETAMSSVAPVANMAGASLEQTTAILGVLVNNGVEASTAGTALRNIFLDLAKEGMTMGEAMDKIKNSTNPLADAMEMFGKRGANVATILANNGVAIKDLTKDFEDSAGEASAMARIMDSGLGGSLRKLMSQVEGLAITLGEMLVPIFTKIMEAVSFVVNGFMNLDIGTKGIIVTIGLLLAAIGPVTTAIGFLSAVVIPKLISMFLALGGPIGVAIGVIAVLGAAFIYIIDNWEALKERFSDVNWWKNSLIEMIQLLTEYSPISLMIKGFNEVLDFFGKEKIANPFEDMADGLEALKGETNDYKNELGTFGDAIGNAVDLVKGQMGKLANMLGFTGGGGGGDPKEPTTTTGKVLMGPPEMPEGFFNGLEEQQKGFFEKSAEEWTAWADNGMKAIEKFAGTYGEVMGQVFDIVNTQIAHEEEALALDTEARLLSEQEKFDAEIARIEGTTESEEVKSDRIAKAKQDLVNNTATIEENAAKKQRKLARKQAVADKAAAALSIVVNTATAVMKMVAAFPVSGGMPWAGIVAGLGAVQLGQVLSAPLPALAEGGLAFGETAALVGDNPNARVDPEVIAPLSKLKGMLGSQEVVVTGTIQGETIYLSNQRYSQRVNSY
tara:strand:+ start:3189 stop:5567 length:2379 start_codon:yes stop_codon:yes gene_type:complete